MLIEEVRGWHWDKCTVIVLHRMTNTLPCMLNGANRTLLVRHL